jgi:hypothetical protein
MGLDEVKRICLKEELNLYLDNSSFVPSLVTLFSQAVSERRTTQTDYYGD